MKPLVDPGPELTPDQIARYRRHLGLPDIGLDGQRRLAASRVLVVGAGGLGAPVLQYLTAAGVGMLGIVDDDVVDESNLQRQVVHGTADLGRAKVDSAADAVQRLNPLVDVVRHRVRLNADSALEILAGYDLVLDCTDNFATRYVVGDAAEILGLPVVWGAILRFDGQVSVFWTGHGPVYRDLFPDPPAPGSVPSCADAGVLGVLPGVIGSLMAAEAIKLITGAGEPLVGRLLMYDALTAGFRTLTVSPDPARTPVTELTDSTAPVCAVSPSTDLSAEQLTALLQRRDRGELEVTVIDVRDEWERRLGTVPGDVSVPLDVLRTDGAAALPDGAVDRELVLYCQSGARSAQALTLLQPVFHGREASVRHLAGGYDAWTAQN